MKEDYMDYDCDIVDNNGVIGNRHNGKNYKTRKKNINFETPLADMLSKEDIDKLKSIG